MDRSPHPAVGPTSGKAERDAARCRYGVTAQADSVRLTRALCTTIGTVIARTIAITNTDMKTQGRAASDARTVNTAPLVSRGIPAAASRSTCRGATGGPAKYGTRTPEFSRSIRRSDIA